jgi:hypothetical protein
LKVIIAGSREGATYQDVEEAVNSVRWNLTEVVSGGARGVDQLGEKYAENEILDLTVMPADWNGPAKKAAGFVRNGEMADYADALIAVWDGKSNGTKNMILSMMHRKKPVYVHFF